MGFRKNILGRWFGKETVNPELTQDAAKHMAELAKQQAFREIFRQTRYAERDGLNEYDEDYSFFIPRGALIPVEMQDAMARLETFKQDQSPETSVSKAIQSDDSAEKSDA